MASKTRAIAAVLIFLSILFAFPAASLLFNSEVILLNPLDNAQWVRPDFPFDIKTRGASASIAQYRKSFLAARGQEAVIKVRARTGVELYLNGRALPGSRVSDAWSEPLSFDLAPYLAPGENELVIEVENSGGVPVAVALSVGLNISTDASWEAREDGGSWSKALPLDRDESLAEAQRFRRAQAAFISELPLLVPIFLVVFALTIFVNRSKAQFVRFFSPCPRLLSIGVMAALLVLALNNFWKLTIEVGFDQSAHARYIIYVAENISIPLATEGWSMFQSPLYYIISAPVFYAFAGQVDDATVIRILRLIPAACLVLMVEAVYRAARHAFPDRKEMQSIAILIGGLLPMNIYLSRGLGNEMLSALFSSCVLAVGFGVLRAEKGAMKKAALMGVFFGLAMLSKVTAVLLAPFVAGVILKRFFLGEQADERMSKTAAALSISFGAAFLISGWYYIRNMLYLGSPLVGNWGQSSVWWQFPSYRLTRHFLGFGDSFLYPAYSSFNSFWDSLYSTMWMDGNFSGAFQDELPLNTWNLDMMFSGVWLALLPAMGIIAGIVISLVVRREKASYGLFLLALCVALYIGAMLDYFLKVPAYTTGKATYTSGITVCYALLGSLGLSALLRGAVQRALVYGWLACWAVYSYGAYFVLQ